jgi:hypothetical protein
MRLINILFLCAFAFLCIAAKPVPDGWRTPTKNETNQDWRNDSHHRYLEIDADFNGDGLIDKAMLLVEKNGHKMALFAFVSQGKIFKKYRLAQEDDAKWLEVMGIEVVKKGKYKTVCGKGYSGCEPGDPNELNLKYESINYFRESSTAVFFYWNDKTKQFDHMQISD